MFKLNPSIRWYDKYVKGDEKPEDISAGAFFIPVRFLEDNVDEDVEQEVKILKYSFSILMNKLRISKNLSLEQLSQKIEVDFMELFQIEKDPLFKPHLRTIWQLAEFYKIPYKALAQVAGAINTNEKLKEDLVKYAAKSSSFEKLTKEEKKQLDEIVKIIKEFGKS
ncbi:MAG: helix-turn-helix transcriptional regulator [Bacteroidota bacterium]|nr:helix-turn-helix transcriptional regulator [Bacteroidota bacterium]